MSTKLYIMTGLPYAGKTTLSRALQQRLGYDVVSVDRIMDERDMWREGHPTQDDWNEAYAEAYRQIEQLLRESKTVIFDCANLPFHERENARTIAGRAGVSHKLVYVNTRVDEIRARWRVNATTMQRGQLTPKMMDDGIQMFEEPDAREQAITYSTEADLSDWIRKHIDYLIDA